MNQGPEQDRQLKIVALSACIMLGSTFYAALGLAIAWGLS